MSDLRLIAAILFKSNIMYVKHIVTHAEYDKLCDRYRRGLFMRVETQLKKSYQAFSKVATPYLHIKDEKHYKEVLKIIESLISDMQDKADEPLNDLIQLLSCAIATYEDDIRAFSKLDADAKKIPADIALFRLLIDQYKLGVNDFPEIGDKSLISKILSGKRNLTKQHIEKLSDRFNIDPGLFF